MESITDRLVKAENENLKLNKELKLRPTWEYVSGLKDAIRVLGGIDDD